MHDAHVDPYSRHIPAINWPNPNETHYSVCLLTPIDCFDDASNDDYDVANDLDCYCVALNDDVTPFVNLRPNCCCYNCSNLPNKASFDHHSLDKNYCSNLDRCIQYLVDCLWPGV